MASLIMTLTVEAYPKTQQWDRSQISHCVSSAVPAQRKGGEQNILENRFIVRVYTGKRMSYTVKWVTVPWQYGSLLLDFIFNQPTLFLGNMLSLESYKYEG